MAAPCRREAKLAQVVMFFSLITLWHDRNRFLPGVLAVSFSSLLVLVQCGVLLGLLSLTSLPVDQASADVWVGHPEVLSVDLGRPIPEHWLARVAREPEVMRSEVFLLGMLLLDKPDGQSSLCTIIGSRLDDESLGAVKALAPGLRRLLSEPGAVVVDESDSERLGMRNVGDLAEVLGRRIRLVGKTTGMKSLAAPYVFCSLETARALFKGVQRDQTIYILAHCRTPEDAQAVAHRLNGHGAMSAYTNREFSRRTQIYWLTATKSGLAVGWAAILGLLVGAAVTSQTLYAATASQLREYAVLNALGVPRWRMAANVVAQSFWVGGAGILLALPVAYSLAALIELLGGKVMLPYWLAGCVAFLTLAMALLSGLAALRSLRLVEPMTLLR
jgi:putative ABC transport system permease protein